MYSRTRIFGFFFVAVLVAAPIAAHAQSADQLRAQIADLLNRINALRAQVQIPSTPATTLTPTQTAPVNVVPIAPSQNGLATFQYSRCPSLQFNLERGDRDSNVAVEVTMLQRFLSQDPTLYPQGEITGFFGPATEAAVQRFQARHGIVARGDFQSTGYGRVGPRTRHAIANSCGVLPANPSQPTNTGNANRADLVVSSIQGPAPHTLQATLRSQSAPSCTSYEIDWGDGTAPAGQQVSAINCASSATFAQQFSHTYTTPGTYVLRARAGVGAIAQLPLLEQRITVSNDGGSTAPGGCFVQPNIGFAPLSIRSRLLFGGTLCDGSLRYTVDWGDGSTQDTGVCSDQNPHFEELRHTYASPGTYQATLRQMHPNARFEENTCTVSVEPASTSTGTVNPITNACSSWTDGCNTCSRTYPGGPAACTQRFCIAAGTPQCYQYFNNATTPGALTQDTLTYRVTNAAQRTVEFTAIINAARQCNGGVYTIIFGDGSNSLQPYPADACRVFTREVTHTYPQNGTYRAILLRDGIVVAQVDVGIFGVTTTKLGNNLASVISAVENFIKTIFK